MIIIIFIYVILTKKQLTCTNPLKSFRARVVDGVWQKGRGMTVPAADTMLGHYVSCDQSQTSEVQPGVTKRRNKKYGNRKLGNRKLGNQKLPVFIESMYMQPIIIIKYD